jgi:hypothetical protein
MKQVRLRKPLSTLPGTKQFDAIPGKGFVKMYYTAIYALVGVPQHGRDLMDFCLSVMDEDNMVVINQMFKERFKAFVSYCQKGTDLAKPHSDSSIKRAIAALRERKLLVETGYRGIYVVNPEFFFRKEEEERIKAIKLMMRFDSDSNEVEIQTDEI